MMFEIIADGSERYDCTMPFRVIFKEPLTVKEFVDEILSEADTYKWWGYIGIYDENIKYHSIFGDPHIEYRNGTLLRHFDDDILNKKVLKANADGGWSRMDFIFCIED